MKLRNKKMLDSGNDIMMKESRINFPLVKANHTEMWNN